MTKKAESDRTDTYTRITDRIAEDLEQGVRPWMKPWSAANTDGHITRPVRHNGLPYSGMNVLLLWSEQVSQGFASSMWMTFKQALELGGSVRKGETGSTVVFASRFTKSMVDGSSNDVDREIPFLKAYSAFNIEQIESLPDSNYASPIMVRDPVERIESADGLRSTMNGLVCSRIDPPGRDSCAQRYRSGRRGQAGQCCRSSCP